MNLSTDIQIGFPLATIPWEFVIVRSTYHQHSTYGWLKASAAQFQKATNFVSETGAATALDFNDIFTTKKGFRFYHVAESTEERLPSRWNGHSDTAACTLALAQSDVSSDAPMILISCNCDFSPESRLSGARLVPVSDSESMHDNKDALLQKWTGAIRTNEPVIALVLFHTDADLLTEALREKRLPIPKPIAIDELDILELLTQPRRWPVLVSVQEYDLPLLAGRLGIAPTHFRPQQPIPDHGAGESKSRITWPPAPPQPSSPRGRAFWKFVNIGTFKIFITLVILAVVAGAGLWGVISRKEGGGGQGQLPDQAIQPPEDMRLPLDGAPVQFVRLPPPPPPTPDTPLQMPAPGTVQEFIGGPMVFVSVGTMPTGLEPFWIDQTEVTTEAFEKCIKSEKCHYDSTPLLTGSGPLCNRGTSRSQYPINCISYNEAVQFCQYAHKRMVTAAEWDFAARGGTAAKPLGGVTLTADSLCWKRTTAGTCVVGTHPFDKGPFGSLDMAGNVAEWTSTKFYSDPLLTARVFRGLSWGSAEITELFPDKPHGLPAEKGQNNLGVRCAKTYSEQDLLPVSVDGGGQPR